LETEVITTSSRLAELADDWNALADRFGNPLLRHEWFAACANASCGRERLAIVAVHAREGLAAVVPLVSCSVAGLTRFRYLGYQIQEPAALLFRDEEALHEALRVALSFGRPIVLPGLWKDMPEIRTLRELCASRASRLVLRDSGSSVWVPLPSSWEAFEASMRSTARKRIRQAARRAGQCGPLTFEAVSPDEQSIETCLRTFLQLEASGWKGRAGTAVLSRPWTTRFWTAYSLATARLGILRLHFLHIAGETVAGRMTVEYGGRVWDLKIAYNERWRQFSPGVLLTHQTFRDAIDRGFVASELLGAAEPWQRQWPYELRYYTTARFYPLSLGGGLAMTCDVGRAAARSAIQAARQVTAFTREPRSAAGI
jgi:CelD/BcsL family acetyltransferase involved in cellulose biosynthesis